MNQFTKTCAENLQTWEDTCSRLVANVHRDGQGNESESSTPTQVPEDYLNAFAPTLPRSFLNEYEPSISALDSRSEFFSGYSGSQPGSRPSSAGSIPYSHYETCSSSSPSPPTSPLPTDSISSNQPARLEVPASPSPSIARASSIASSNPFCNSLDATAAIRAAYSASVRKKKSFHRSSWNPSPAEFSALTGRPLRTENQASPHSPRSNFTSPLSPPSPSTVGPLTPASISNNGRSPLSVFQPVSSC